MAVTPNITESQDQIDSRPPGKNSRVRTPARAARVRVPLWRRLTALVSLSSLVIIVGVLVAAITGTSILLLLLFLERAAG